MARIRTWSLPREGDAAMAGIAGVRPVGQLMGACVYHSEYIGGNEPVVGDPGEVYRYHASIEAVRVSRQKALERLAGNARESGADAVVGVRVTHTERRSRDLRDSGGTVEAIATGTAIALPDVSWPDRPWELHDPPMSTVDLQEYWKLTHGGYACRGVVTSTVMVGCRARGRLARVAALNRLSRQGRGNRELPDVTVMAGSAYLHAEDEIYKQAYALKADGIVDVRFDARKWLVRSSRLTFKMSVTVTGTAVSRGEESSSLPPFRLARNMTG